MEGFFEYSQGETITATQNNTSQIQRNDEDQFQFANNHNQNFGSNLYDSNQISTQVNNDPFTQNENIKKMRQQEQRINQMLRTKANQQYEEKQKRKQKGRKELEDFLSKKQQQKNQRQQQNLKKEQQQKNDIRRLNQAAGWRKVFANVSLKQGQHPGSKDTNRMRQAIVHKRQDMDRDES